MASLSGFTEEQSKFFLDVDNAFARDQLIRYLHGEADYKVNAGYEDYTQKYTREYTKAMLALTVNDKTFGQLLTEVKSQSLKKATFAKNSHVLDALKDYNTGFDGKGYLLNDGSELGIADLNPARLTGSEVINFREGYLKQLVQEANAKGATLEYTEPAKPAAASQDANNQLFNEIEDLLRPANVPKPVPPAPSPRIPTQAELIAQSATTIGNRFSGPMQAFSPLITPNKKIVSYIADGILSSKEGNPVDIRRGVAEQLANAALTKDPTLLDKPDAVQAEVTKGLRGGIEKFIADTASDEGIRKGTSTAFFDFIDKNFPQPKGAAQPAWLKNMHELAENKGEAGYKEWLDKPLFADVQAAMLRAQKEKSRTAGALIANTLASSKDPDATKLRNDYLPAVEQKLSQWLRNPVVDPELIKKKSPITGFIGGLIGQLPPYSDKREEISKQFFEGLDKRMATQFQKMGVKEPPAGVKEWRDNLEAMSKSDWKGFLKQKLGPKEIMDAAVGVKPDTMLATIAPVELAPVETASPVQDTRIANADKRSDAPLAPAAVTELSAEQKKINEQNTVLKAELERASDARAKAQNALKNGQKNIGALINEGMEERRKNGGLFDTPMPGMSASNPMGFGGTISSKTIASLESNRTVVIGSKQYDLSSPEARAQLTEDAGKNYKAFIGGHIVATKTAKDALVADKNVIDAETKLAQAPKAVVAPSPLPAKSAVIETAQTAQPPAAAAPAPKQQAAVAAPANTGAPRVAAAPITPPPPAAPAQQRIVSAAPIISEQAKKAALTRKELVEMSQAYLTGHNIKADYRLTETKKQFQEQIAKMTRLNPEDGLNDGKIGAASVKAMHAFLSGENIKLPHKNKPKPKTDIDLTSR